MQAPRAHRFERHVKDINVHFSMSAAEDDLAEISDSDEEYEEEVPEYVPRGGCGEWGR